MAIYKATYCYPFLDTIDPRTAIDLRNGDGGEPPHVFLKCKVDSSNKNVTGYSIRILDGNNQQIFPFKTSTFEDLPSTISPISELPQNLGKGINSGINGTYLHIPFFQNWHNPYIYPRSINALYYNIAYQVQYIIKQGEQGADNSDSWSIDSTSSRLVYNGGFDGIINGEIVSIGDLVLIYNSDVNKNGVWKMTKEGNFERVKPLQGGDTFLITQGKYHNVCFRYYSNQSIIEEIQEKTLWYDYQADDAIDLFNGTSNHSYKWEITLYQGEGIEINTAGSHCMDYDNLDPIHYDTVLTSGTILGSTPSRIQISDLSEKNLPSDSTSEIVILQGKYIQLLGTNILSANTALGVRAYVKNYDASYGHIYTLDGSITEDILNIAPFCIFYKQSNDPDSILAGDRVNCATTKPVALSGKITDGKVDGYIINNDDLILVKDQADAKTNGVYRYNNAGAWKRAGSFTTWGDFLGKILYVENGTANGGKNFQSLAQPGGRLYTEGSTLVGDSQLFFVEEKPIILFPFLIKKEVTIYYEGEAPSPISESQETLDGSFLQGRLDGYTLRDGDTILMKLIKTGQDPKYGIYQYNTVTQHLTPVDTWGHSDQSPENQKKHRLLYRIMQGKTWGGTILNGKGLDNSTPYVAKVLKNGKDWTYISPYIGLKKRQMLIFTNGTFSHYDTQDTQTNSLKVLDVDTKFWKISHDDLAMPFLSYSNTEEKDKIPLKYNLCTFFKESNQNPFYCYESPYLKLVSGDGGALDINVYQDFQLFPPSDDLLLEVMDDGGSIFSVLMPSIVGSGGRDITLKGIYHQGQMASWESYRWVLRNSKYQIVQDTGLLYNKEMKVTFYGLSNEADNNVYFATLYVTDTLNNSLAITIQIVVDVEAKQYFSSYEDRFTATFDCNTHSILIKSGDTIEDIMGDVDGTVSYYKREYKKYYASAGRDSNGNLVYTLQEFKGEWTPVLLSTSEIQFRDFNITSDRSYQYIMTSDENGQIISQAYANTQEILYNIMISNKDYYESIPNKTSNEGVIALQNYQTALNNWRNASLVSGEATKTHWGNWSLTELIPVKNSVDTPAVKKTYKADINNIWLFKYALETGSQTQNLAKNEVTTLGRFSRVAAGATNTISGQVSCYLGSEIAPSSRNGYIERTRANITSPQTTNERVQMLHQWRSIAFSGNPKLLKDAKGESWIIAITSNQNTPSNHIYKQPDQISFNWREIESNDNIIIYGSGEEIKAKEGFQPEWFEE